jgi:hypothetical protein
MKRTERKENVQRFNVQRPTLNEEERQSARIRRWTLDVETLNVCFDFKKMDLSTLANVATALTVLTGVAFGLIEMRRARRDREERAAFAAVQALMTPEWMSSSMIVASIPEGTTAEELGNDQRTLEAALKIAPLGGGRSHRRHGAGRLAQISTLRARRTRAHRDPEKLGMVPMAGGTARTPRHKQDKLGSGRAGRLSRLEALGLRFLPKSKNIPSCQLISKS